jgi:hypothetical protein
MREHKRAKASKRKRSAAIAGVVTIAETVGLWRRTGRLAGNVVVRCRSGHVYTTLWIPAVSVKAARLGPWRFQRCPVGRHWSLVTPVRESDLSDADRRSAREHHDVRLP